jgi:hypothetical protein
MFLFKILILRNNIQYTGFGLDSLFYEVLQAINDWNPQNRYSTERKYRDDLLAFLQKKLNGYGDNVFSSPIWGVDHSGQHFIKKEAGRGLADIGIDDEIGIELKLNLKQKSQINRLVGQVVDYLSAYSCVIIVLCGHTKWEAVGVLKYNLKRIVRSSDSLFGQEKLIRIVFKDGSQKAREAKKPLAVVW